MGAGLNRLPATVRTVTGSAPVRYSSVRCPVFGSVVTIERTRAGPASRRPTPRHCTPTVITTRSDNHSRRCHAAVTTRAYDPGPPRSPPRGCSPIPTDHGACRLPRDPSVSARRKPVAAQCVRLCARSGRIRCLLAVRDSYRHVMSLLVGMSFPEVSALRTVCPWRISRRSPCVP